MKSYLFNLSLLLFVASFSFGQNSNESNEITFEQHIHKFKKVDEGKQLQYKYTFTYSGKEQLNISHNEIDCTCTEVILPETPIQSEKKYTVIINFDTKDKIGYQEREVVLNFIPSSDSTSIIQKKLIFKGVVKASPETKAAYKKNKRKK